MITGSISSTDYLNAQRLHRSKIVVCYNLFSLFSTLLGIGVLVSGNLILGCALIGTGVGCFIGETISNTWFFPRKISRLHSQHKELHSKFTYEWDDQTIQATSQNGQSLRPWKNYSKFRENDKILLLYHADNLFEMFPTEWFNDPQQLQEFRNHAQRAGT